MSLIPGGTGTASSFPDGLVGSQLGNVETISATKILVASDRKVQILTPSGATRTVQLPATALTGETWEFINASATQSLVVTSSNTSTILTLSPGSDCQVNALSTTPTASTDWKTSSNGDVIGPASATDNAIVRFDTTGKTIQNSDCTISDTGAVILGPTSSDAINHRINGTIGISSTLSVSSSSFRFVGTDNSGLMVSTGDSGSTYMMAGGYYNGSNYIARAANTAIGGFRTAPPTSDSSVVAEWYKQTDSSATDYTFSAGSSLTTQTSLGSLTAAGVWTLGNTAKIGSNDYAGQLLVGRTNGSAVAVGYVGQILESTYTSDTAFNATTVWGNNASVTLTPGVWLLFGAFTAKLSTGTGFTSYNVDVSATNGGTDTSPNNYAEALPPTSSTNTQTTIAGVYANVTANTTYYLNYRGFYSGGSPKHTGRLRAVRIA